MINNKSRIFFYKSKQIHDPGVNCLAFRIDCAIVCGLHYIIHAHMKSIPEDRMFDRHHGWIEMEDEFIGRCGISAQYLNRLDIVEFIEFPEVDMEVRMGEHVAMLESSIDYFKYRSPVSGRITEINHKLETNPELMNSDPYDEGWIYKIDVKEPRELDELLNGDEYKDYIDSSGDI